MGENVWLRLEIFIHVYSLPLYAQYLSFWRGAPAFCWPFTYSNHLIYSITYYILSHAVPSCHVDIFKHIFLFSPCTLYQTAQL
jgi:hypothetical protein